MDIKDLKNRKKALKMTTADIAYHAELPVSTVSKIMTGETRNPSYITIEKIETVILNEEMKRRIIAYRDAIMEYYSAKDVGEALDYFEFDKKYRRDNHLDDAPIPYARSKDESKYISDSTIRKNELRVDVNMLSKLDEDKYIELIDGNIIISQAPSVMHQMLVQNIGKAIDQFIEKNHGNCKLFNVGINVQIDEDDYTMLIPDIVVLCQTEKLNENGILGAPDLVMEVTSKSSKRLDYNDKMHKYMRAGVREYWIVDPEAERVTVYIEGEPMLAYIYNFNDSIPVGIYNGELEICVNDII